MNHVRQYYRSKYQTYHRDDNDDDDQEFFRLGWYKSASSDMLICVKRCIISKEKFYRKAVNSSSEETETEFYTLKERITSLFNNKMWSDVVLNINEKKFFGHRLILSLASPVFKKSFYSELNSTGKESYDIIDSSECGFENLLRFIYTNNISETVTLEELMETLYAARIFFVSPAVQICSQQCIEYLNVNNLCQILDLAYYLDLETLIDKCMQFYTIHSEEVLTSDSFLSTKTETVLFLFRKSIECGKKKEFNFHLMKWALNEVKKRQLPSFEIATVLKPFINMNLSSNDTK